MMSPSRITVDNTLIAGAGRFAYRDATDVLGGDHARQHYQIFQDEELSDFRSFCEFITAAVLFDELCWNASSNLSEPAACLERRRPASWVADLFPIFADATTSGLIRGKTWPFHELKLMEAWYLAARYVTHVGTPRLPLGFRMPEIYVDSEHPDRPALEAVLAAKHLELSPEQTALALFIGRGLFYQSDALDQNYSYLPHVYRSFFLSDPVIARYSPLLSDLRRSQEGGTELLADIERTFAEEVRETFGDHGAEHFDGVAGAFILKGGGRAVDAWLAVLEFRDSPAGRNVRRVVRDLLELNRTGSRLEVQGRIQEIREQLRDVQRRHTGWASGKARTDDAVTDLLKQGAGGLGFLLRPLKFLIPLAVRERLVRLGFTAVSPPSGVQVIFGSYFDARRNSG